VIELIELQQAAGVSVASTTQGDFDGDLDGRVRSRDIQRIPGRELDDDLELFPELFRAGASRPVFNAALGGGLEPTDRPHSRLESYLARVSAAGEDGAAVALARAVGFLGVGELTGANDQHEDDEDHRHHRSTVRHGAPPSYFTTIMEPCPKRRGEKAQVQCHATVSVHHP
jgi:hypothetical protein